MRIIDAVWETRNFGITSKEIDVEPGDKPETLEQIRNLDCDYAVVRVPAGSVEIMFKLDDMGYHFIETILNLQHDHRNIGSTLNSTAKRIADSITYDIMDETELTQLWNQLRMGIFNTDRIYLDPAFTPEQSAIRYINWINDEIARGGNVHKCVLKGNIFGYFVSRINTENVNYVYNIGTYKGYETSGLGVCLVHTSIRQAYEAGAKKTISGLSTNNIPSVTANLAAGYRITTSQYIYIKHRKEKN
jgi:hypothetical protein